MENKQAYVSPPIGTLEITVIRDAQPRVLINLDLGIPNFTVFSMKLPLVEDQPKAMSGLIAESVHVLLDEVASFMMSMEYEEDVIVTMYATVLAAFKGMSSEADSSKEQDKAGADPIVKTFEGTFNLPMTFVNETQKKVVTASLYDDLSRLRTKFNKFYYDKTRNRLSQTYQEHRSKENGKALSDYQWPKLKALFEEMKPFFLNEPLFARQQEETYRNNEMFDYAAKNMQAAEDAIKEGMDDISTMFQDTALADFHAVLDWTVQMENPDRVQEVRLLDKMFNRPTAATKIKRPPKVRHVELSYDPAPKTTVNDAARVIRQYRNRSLKQQPKPLYVIVYDQQGRPTGTLALGPKFKNQLLSITQKRAAVDFTSPVSFPSEEAMKTKLLDGIPKTISVGGMTYLPEGVAGADMALYHGPQDYLVKFPDGRSQIFPGRPTFRNMRRLNFPVPRNRFKWTLLPQEEVKPEEPSIKPEETTDATSGGTV